MVDLEQCSLCAVISPVYHGGPWAVQSLCCHQHCITWWTLSSAVSVLWSALYIMVDLQQCSLCAVISPVYHGGPWAVQSLCCHQPCISWWTLSSAVSVLSSALYIMVDLEQYSLCAVISPVYHGGPWAVQSLCCHQPCISWWTLSSAVSVLSSALYIMVDLEQCSLCAVISPVCRLILLRQVVFGQMFYQPTHGNLLQQLTDEGNVWDRPVVVHCISIQVILLKKWSYYGCSRCTWEQSLVETVVDNCHHIRYMKWCRLLDQISG